MSSLSLHRDVNLRERTTLEVGGPARVLARCGDPEGLRRALEIADDEHLERVVLGGGSNVLVSDRGFDGMVIQYVAAGLSADLQDGRVRVDAGYEWDRLVAWTVEHDLTGLECLSGIPGWVGAAPIQNIGAYGQEVGARIRWVHTLRLCDGREISYAAHECGFAYRDSRFKRDVDDPCCVTGLELALDRGGTPVIAYAELAARLSREGVRRDAAGVRATVLEIRQTKSMVHRADDPNRRSAGSFFTNPVVDTAVADAIASDLDDPSALPRWEVRPGSEKLAAAWLIEHAGFAKGYVRGNAGISSAHTLALINRGGATAAELIGLAREVRDRVLDRFGVRLRPEPVALGFTPDELGDLW